MIERVVLVKLKDELCNSEARKEIAEYTQDKLEYLEGVKSISVGLPADEASEKSWDLSIILRFEDLESMERYRVHPQHRAYVDDYLAPKMVVIKAWNFEAPT